MRMGGVVVFFLKIHNKLKSLALVSSEFNRQRYHFSKIFSFRFLVG